MSERLFASFPYAPYDIQQQFMLNVVDTLKKRQIGLFESPTGTGKTLSIICSTLCWLESERERLKAEADAAAAATQGSASDLPDWLVSSHVVSSPPAARQQQQQRKPKIAAPPKCKTTVLDDDGNDLSEFLPEGANKQQPSSTCTPGTKRSGASHNSSSSSSDDDDIDAGRAAEPAEGTGRKRPQVIFCSRTHSQLSQFVGELHRTRFASSILMVAVASRKALCVNDQVRELSELSQVNERCLELQRNKGSKSSSNKRTSLQKDHGVRSDSTGGVIALSGAARPKQQQQRNRKAAGCPFLHVQGTPAAFDDFQELVLGTPMDVEELAAVGRNLKVCPYYGSRRAVPSADVVLAPYSAVLMPDARESLGIDLQDSVLIFDEAHNLLDAINSAHSTNISGWQLLSVQRSLTAYYERFKGLLNPRNAQHIQALLRIGSALHNCLQQSRQQVHEQPAASLGPTERQASSTSRVLTVNDLLFDLGLDNINMLELAAWVKENKMAFKVSGYTAAAVDKAGGSIQLQHSVHSAARSAADDNSIHQQDQLAPQQQALGNLSARDGVSAIHTFVAFLLSLTHADADGRIVVDPAPATHTASPVVTGTAACSTRTEAVRSGQLRFVLLNAARHFGQLLASARSVLLVSGTLAPIEGLQAQLFPDVAAERVRHFECGHVVPVEQLLAVPIGRGPSGRALVLKHEARSDPSMIAELGHVLVNLCSVVPQGLVVFMPSFGYLEQLSTVWKASGVWDRLSQRKQVFCEPRSAQEVDAVLEAYAAAVNSCQGSSETHVTDQDVPSPLALATSSLSSGTGRTQTGALMLCVVGAKLSEGINFGDGLGRCVVVVGLPYPNHTDVELQARMQYLDRLVAKSLTDVPAADSATILQHLQPRHRSKSASGTDAQPLQLQQQDQPQPHQCITAPSSRSAFHILHSKAPPTKQSATPASDAIAGGSTQQAYTTPSSQQAPEQPTGSAVTVAAPEPRQQLQQKLAGDVSNQHTSTAPTQAQTAAASTSVVRSSTESSLAASGSSKPLKLLTGRDYYENLCFKAVNQCVGRVVRHSRDYAAVVLLDMRWTVSPADWAAISSHGCSGSSTTRQQKVPVLKLPGWLQKSFVPTNGDFGPGLKQLAGFFKSQALRSTS